MNTLIYLHNLQINGSNIVALNHVIELKKRKWDVIISSPSDGPLSTILSDLGCSIEIEGEGTLRARSATLYIVNSLIRFDAASMLTNHGVRFFQYVHEDWAPKDFIGGLHPEWGWYLPAWEDMKKYLGGARCLIFPANYLKQNYDHQFNTYTITNPVNPKFLEGITQTPFARSCRYQLINVGTINVRKNQKLIVDTVEASQELLGCDFYGDRHLRREEILYAESIKQITNNSTKDYNFFPVKFPLAMEIKANHLFMLTSLAEVAPCSLQEMVALKVPIIAPRKFGIPEIVEHGVNGILFDEYTVENILLAVKQVNELSMFSDQHYFPPFPLPQAATDLLLEVANV